MVNSASPDLAERVQNAAPSRVLDSEMDEKISQLARYIPNIAILGMQKGLSETRFTFRVPGDDSVYSLALVRNMLIVEATNKGYHASAQDGLPLDVRDNITRAVKSRYPSAEYTHVLGDGSHDGLHVWGEGIH